MRSFRLLFAIGVVLILLYIVAEYNRPRPLDWRPTLSYEDKIPYGTYVLYNEIHQLFPGSKLEGTNESFYDLFHSSTDSSSNYLVIVNALNIGKYDFKAMGNYISAGNSIFIAAESFGELGDTLNLRTHTPIGNTANLNFTNVRIKHAKDYRFGNGIANTYFSYFDTTKVTVLAKNEDGKSTFIRYRFGKGSLYLCSNPKLFTNYSLLNTDGADFVAKAISYMRVSPVIYWDHFQNGDFLEDTSPMRVFFRYPRLQWAYYITLFSLVVFILYEMKRRQRIIPVIEPLKNTSVDFVKVVGQVYYEQRNNANLAQKKILYFLEYLRTNYYLKTNILDQEFIEKLSQKTGIEHTLADELVMHVHYLKGQRVSDAELIRLNQLIEQFYRKTR
ncbi:MAG TPA: DUF4350 domain-containing protein [Mucilaginibacter sp.]|jgi:hypothetical protein|nr:DUF4350 domain-containing protein [Mucilaginibacter sp.]